MLEHRNDKKGHEETDECHDDEIVEEPREPVWRIGQPHYLHQFSHFLLLLIHNIVNETVDWCDKDQNHEEVPNPRQVRGEIVFPVVAVPHWNHHVWNVGVGLSWKFPSQNGVRDNVLKEEVASENVLIVRLTLRDSLILWRGWVLLEGNIGLAGSLRLVFEVVWDLIVPNFGWVNTHTKAYSRPILI